MSKAAHGVRVRGKYRGGRSSDKIRVRKSSTSTYITRYQKDGVKYVNIRKYDYRNRLISDNTYIEK